VVSHTWDELFDDFIKALEWSDHPGPFWICSFALYQHFEDEGPDQTLKFESQFGPDPMMGNYKTVLQQADALLVVITSQTSNPFKRFFCRMELACARMLGKPVHIITAITYSREHGLADSLMDVVEAENPSDDPVLPRIAYTNSHSEIASLLQDLEQYQCGDRSNIKQWDVINHNHLLSRMSRVPDLEPYIARLQHQALLQRSVDFRKLQDVVESQPHDMAWSSFIEKRLRLAEALFARSAM